MHLNPLACDCCQHTANTRASLRTGCGEAPAVGLSEGLRLFHGHCVILSVTVHRQSVTLASYQHDALPRLRGQGVQCPVVGGADEGRPAAARRAGGRGAGGDGAATDQTQQRGTTRDGPVASRLFDSRGRRRTGWQAIEGSTRDQPWAGERREASRGTVPAVVAEQDTLRSRNVGLGDGPETLLAGCIPDLVLHHASPVLHVPSAAAAAAAAGVQPPEIYPNRCNKCLSKPLAPEPPQKHALSRVGVAQQEPFKHIPGMGRWPVGNPARQESQLAARTGLRGGCHKTAA